MYVPEGYGTVFPYMLVKQADKFVEFLKNAFDAREIDRTDRPDGTIANSRARIGTSTFMVSEAGEGGLGAVAGAYYLYVENADQTVAKAVAHGATKIFDAMDMPYGDRQGGVSPIRLATSGGSRLVWFTSRTTEGAHGCLQNIVRGTPARWRPHSQDSPLAITTCCFPHPL
jgi:PhnB protein